MKCFDITNTLVQNVAVRISSLNTCAEVFAETKRFVNKFKIHESYLLMSSLRAKKYFRVTVISSQILFPPSLVMRRCIL